MKPAIAIDRAALVLLALFVFTLPLEKAFEVPGIGTVARAAGLLAFAAGAASAVARHSLRRPNLALLLAAAFVAWSGLTYFWSVAPEVTAARIQTLAQLLGMAWLIWELCRSDAGQRLLMAAYVGGAAVSSGFTASRYLAGRQTNYRRYATAGFDPNDLGITLALALPMALYLASRARGIAAWLFRLSALVAIAGILLTASRTALIAASISFVFSALTWRQSGFAHKASSALLLALLVLGAVRLAPPASRQRLATLPKELTRATFHGRTRIWKTGLKVLKRHPLAGCGAGAYPEAVRPWLGTTGIPGQEYTAHNTFLSVLVETGAAGFLIFGLLLAVLLVFAWMLASAERALWFTALAVWLAGISTLTWENRKPTWLIFALIMTAWARAFLPPEDEA